MTDILYFVFVPKFPSPGTLRGFFCMIAVTVDSLYSVRL